MLQLIQSEIDRMSTAQKLRDITPEQQAQSDRKAWQGWLARYAARLQRDADAGANHDERVKAMNAINPR